MQPLVFDELAQRILTGMAKRGMANIVSEADCLGEVLVQRQIACNRAADLGDLQGVRQPGDVVIALRVDEDLRLVLQPSKRLRVDDAVPVPLEGSPVRIVELGESSPL